jgi:hypothetical protein
MSSARMKKGRVPVLRHSHKAPMFRLVLRHGLKAGQLRLEGKFS